MKIRLERTGGFAGMSTTIEIDTGSLSEEERAHVTRLVEDADFFALQADMLRSDPASADRFQYRITIESTDSTHTVEATESAAPEALAELIDWLNRNARAARSPSDNQR